MARLGFKSRQPRRFPTVSAWLSSPDRRPLASSWAPARGHYPRPALPRCPSLASSAHHSPTPRSGVSQAPFIRVRAQTNRARPASASPQHPLLAKANAAPGPPAQAWPTALGTLWVYRGPFFQQAQSTFPSVISLARAQPRECGRGSAFPHFTETDGASPSVLLQIQKRAPFSNLLSYR